MRLCGGAAGIPECLIAAVIFFAHWVNIREFGECLSPVSRSEPSTPRVERGLRLCKLLARISRDFCSATIELMPFLHTYFKRLFTAGIPILWVLSDLCVKVCLIPCDRDLRSICRRAETGIGNALGGYEESDAVTEEADRPLRFSDRSLYPRCGCRADIRRFLR